MPGDKMAADYAVFPNIERARGTRDAERAFIVRLLENYAEYGQDGGLAEVNAILGRLNPADLDEQVDALFGERIGQWLKAYTELLALDAWNEAGILKAIGWPAGSGGHTAPFDACLQIDGVEVPVDIKSGMGSGLNLIDEKLSPVVEAWRLRLGLDPVDFDIRHDGPPAQTVVGQNVGELLSLFRAELDTHNCLPGDAITVELAGGPTNGGVRLLVELSQGSVVRMRSGVSGTIPHADALASFIADQAKHKAEMSEAHCGKQAFLLAYVVPFGSADTDMRPWVTQTALRKVDATLCGTGTLEEDLWLGALYLSYLEGGLRCSAFLRDRPTYPAGLNADAIGQAVGIEERWQLSLR